MAKTSSTMLPLGTHLPAFALKDPDGKIFDTQTIDGCRAFLVIFLCNHCPYVKHIAAAVARVTSKLLEQSGVYVVGINSNDTEKYPDDRPELMKAEALNQGYLFPYLFDESQQVAKTFRAACTPEFYLFDGMFKLAYRGQFDASRPGNLIQPSGDDLLAAYQEVLEGRFPTPHQVPSLGCNIKWKPGQEPDYR